PDVGLRRGGSVRQTPAARSLAFAESPARNPRILLEFQGLGRPARTEESGDGGGPDRGQRPTAQREPGTALYPGLSADGRSAFSARYRAVAWLNTWNGYCCIGQTASQGRIPRKEEKPLPDGKFSHKQATLMRKGFPAVALVF